MACWSTSAAWSLLPSFQHTLLLTGNESSAVTRLKWRSTSKKKRELTVAFMDLELDGTRLEGRGVEPDVVVPFQFTYSGGRDPQLETALQVLSGLYRFGRSGPASPSTCSSTPRFSGCSSPVRLPMNPCVWAAASPVGIAAAEAGWRSPSENQKKAISLLPADADRGEYQAALAKFQGVLKDEPEKLPTEQEAVAFDQASPARWSRARPPVGQ